MTNTQTHTEALEQMVARAGIRAVVLHDDLVKQVAWDLDDIKWNAEAGFRIIYARFVEEA